MKKKNKGILYVIGMALIMIVSASSVIYINHKNSDGLNSEFVIDMSEKNYRKVYLLDESSVLVPLSVEVTKKEYVIDEIYTVVSHLRDLKVKGFENVLPQDVKINKIELKDGILNIDFSNEFLNYDKNLEEKIIESLTWSVMEFKEVRGLTISVEGSVLKKMPVNGMALPEILNKEIGINKYNDMVNNCINCESIVLLYSKNIEDNEYYVPITRKIDNSVNDNILEGYKKDVSVVSMLNKISELENLSMMSIKDDMINIEVDSSLLLEENLVDSKVYKLLMVNLFYNNLDYKVNFIFDEENIEVNGYNMNDSFSVSEISFNEIKI